MAAKSEPDGHTILVYGSIAAANALYARLPYDTVADFTPVVPFGETPLVVVTAAGRYKTLAELIAAAKAKPGELNTRPSASGPRRIGAVWLPSVRDHAQHIPFRVLSGGRYDRGTRRLQRSPVTTSSAPSVTASSRRWVGAARGRSLPDVPTLSKPDLRPMRLSVLYRSVLPGQHATLIVDKLHDEVVNALALPSVQERLAKIGVEKLPMTVAEFDRFFKDDVAANLELGEGGQHSEAIGPHAGDRLIIVTARKPRESP